jgi:beta-glucosidase
MSDVAQLLCPGITWSRDGSGYAAARPLIDEALKLGVGGFILFGGTNESVRALTRELQQRSRTPLLIGADLERGAGQQFTGATELPPLAAIASLGDADALRRVARLTAREARTLGVNWDYAPVCDLDVLPENPVIGARSLGGDPKRVADLAAEWVDACQSEGVLSCAKHFPGHGRTADDSHATLPVVATPAETLHQTDLLPFKAVIDAGVGSMMTAHVAYPALDPTGLPATLSREILQWLLRQRLGFDGLVVSDALAMEGVLQGRTQAEAAVLAVQAGCDMLLYPSRLAEVVEALERAAKSGALDPERVRQSLRRRLRWAQWVSPPNDYRRPSASDALLGGQLADRCIHLVRGGAFPLGTPVDVVAVDDDDPANPGAGPRGAFDAALKRAAVDARRVDAPTADARGPVVLALFGEARPRKGRAGYSPATRARVAEVCAAARRAARDTLVVQFAHPRFAEEIPEAANVVCAWGGDRVMQEAAARRLVKRG